MRDYYVLDEELFDKVEVDDSENKEEKEIKKEKGLKRFYKAVKIMLYAVMGSAAAMLSYKTSDNKDKNTDYLDRFWQ